MSLRVSFFKKTFHFNFKARTSRGLMADKTSWFIRMTDDDRPDVVGWGECGPLPGLSIDHSPGFEADLQAIIDKVNAVKLNSPDVDRLYDLVPAAFPSIRFGMETAAHDLANGGQKLIYDNAFVRGNPIPINGLIWMGDLDFMMEQINKKVAEGYRCIKLKVGGLDFDRECDVLSYIRKRYFRNDLMLRLDANGAFKREDVLYRLDELAKFNIHSIEQPIKPGLEEMEELCRKSPIPIALDEELIGFYEREKMASLLRKLKPQFIVLKPTLHGGLRGCEEWISLAEAMNIGWWMTSALESSVGLNAICQFTARYEPSIPQGLGTGAIYTDNFASPLTVREGQIYFDKTRLWSDELA